MGAHLRSIVISCKQYGCSSRATQELYNAVNAPLGAFCTKHAKPALAKFIKEHPNA